MPSSDSPAVGEERDLHDRDRERIIDEIGRCLSGVEDLLLGYVYGSFLTRSDFHDIDIGLLISGERTPYELFKYAMKIAFDVERCITPRYDVDLRIINTAPVEFQYEVVKTGRVVFARDESLRVAFEADVLAEYLDLKHLYDRMDRSLLAPVNR
jgi:uncharacterized protein